MDIGIISIKQKYIDKIFSQEKTIEIRKSKPNKKTKFYIYSTKSDGIGKIVGTFIVSNFYDYLNNNILEKTCCTLEEINKYSKGKNLYYWEITKINKFKKPKILNIKAPNSWCLIKKGEKNGG